MTMFMLWVICCGEFFHVTILISTVLIIFIYLFGVLRRFQHCIGHITMGSFLLNGKPVHAVDQGYVL